MKQVIKEGDYVVCTLKERPDYFNDEGLMDKFLNEKNLLLVKNTHETDVYVWDEETNECWFIQKEDLIVVWTKPQDQYIIKPWVCDYGVYDTAIDEFVSIPLSLDDARKVLDIYNKSLNDNKLNKKEGYND